MAFKYNLINEIPPHQLLQIVDDNGREWIAYPKYVNYKLINNVRENCKEYWNGEWLIQYNILNFPHSASHIIGWRTIFENEI